MTATSQQRRQRKTQAVLLPSPRLFLPQQLCFARGWRAAPTHLSFSSRSCRAAASSSTVVARPSDGLDSLPLIAELPHLDWRLFPDAGAATAAAAGRGRGTNRTNFGVPGAWGRALSRDPPRGWHPPKFVLLFSACVRCSSFVVMPSIPRSASRPAMNHFAAPRPVPKRPMNVAFAKTEGRLNVSCPSTTARADVPSCPGYAREGAAAPEAGGRDLRQSGSRAPFLFRVSESAAGAKPVKGCSGRVSSSPR